MTKIEEFWNGWNSVNSNAVKPDGNPVWEEQIKKIPLHECFAFGVVQAEQFIKTIKQEVITKKRRM